MGYIYKITNIVNNKIYIGQTSKTIEERFAAHIKKAKQHTNRYLYDAMNKYGYDKFFIEEIENISNNQLDEREIYWIAFYNSTNPEIGYNMTSGGGGGNTWINNPHKEETSKKISLANKGKKHNMSSEGKEKIVQSNKELKTIPVNKDELEKDIKNYMSIEDICTKYKISRKTLYNKCKEFFNATPTEIRGDKLKHSNSLKIELNIQQIEKYIQQNKTLKEMAKLLNVSQETVRRTIVKYYGKTLKEVRKDVKSKNSTA